jgi:hypothetical protein
VTRQVGLALISAVTVAFTLTVMGAAIADRGYPSASAAARTFDRAYLCTNQRHRGVRQIAVFAKTGFRDSGAWEWLGEAGISNLGEAPTKIRGSPTPAYIHWSFGSSGGSGPVTSNPTQPGAREHYFQVWSKLARACKAVPRRRVPLSARGLSGGAVDYFGDTYSCPAPPRAYVRVRAIFQTPMSLRLDRRSMMLKTDVPVQQASFVIRTESGKPFAYASVSESGQARVFTSPACIAD